MGQGKTALVAVVAALGLVLAGGCSTAHVDELAPTTARTTATKDDALEHATRDDVFLHDAFTRSAFEEHGLGFVSPGWTKALRGDFDSLSVVAPKRSDASFQVSLGQVERWNVGLALSGVSAESAERTAGRLTYRGVQQDADLLALSTDTRFELALVVRSPDAPRRSEWPINLASGLRSEVLSDAAGRLTSIEFEDATGRTRLRMPRPYAVDANGKRVELTVEWQDNRLALTLPAGDLAYPVIVDPAVEQSLWVKIATTGDPGANNGHGFVYDSTRKVVVMFGGAKSLVGNGYSQAVNEVWELSGTTWTKKTWSGASPTARVAPCFMYDGARSVLYGGNTTPNMVDTKIYSDAWAWSGSAWTQPFTNVPTTGGMYGYIDCAWDQHANVGVLFGQLTSNATVELRGNAWGAPLTPTFNYSYSPGLTYDAREQFVIGSDVQSVLGYGSSGVHGWNLGTWGTLALAAPFYVRYWFYDPRRAAMVAVGMGSSGSVNTYEDSTDAHRAPQASTPNVGVVERVVFDSDGNRAVMYNGSTWIYEHRGGSCAQNSQCDTGFCVDGVCCAQAACAGTCMSCAVSDPTNNVFPGTCNVVRGAPDSDSCSGTKTCDKNGACRTANGQSCTAGGDCVSGLCAGNTCLGNTCGTDTDCASGHCVDHICCNDGCNIGCQACKASLQQKAGGIDGVCANAKGNTDPHDECPSPQPGTCQSTGVCDGNGACSKVSLGTTCGGNVCADRDRTAPRVCDGIGGCGTGTPTACAPCGCATMTGACATSCATSSDCDSTTGTCIDSQCVTRVASGKTCSADSDCATGHCADGVCCDRACSGQCEACNVAQSEGACVPVLGAPRNARPACDVASATNPCTARLCNGVTATSCEGYAAADIECQSGGCAADVQSLAAHCDGKGACPAPVTKTCAPFACGTTTCLTSCATEADCVGGTHCDQATKTCNTASVCKDDHDVANPNGTVADCSPYRCASGACLTACKNVDDCAAPAVCDATLHCVPPSAAEANSATDDTGGGCSITPRERDRRLPWALLALAVVAVRRRRR